MALTATTLRSLLKANLHNDTTISDPTDLDTFLTLGQQQMILDSPATLGAKSANISVTASTRTYTLAADFFQMRGVFYAANGYHLPLIPLTEWIDTVERLPTIPSGAPQAYTLTHVDVTSTPVWTISFDHIPDAAYTYKYWYYWMPADISSTITPPVSAIGFGKLLLWAATMIARERNDPDGFIAARQAYLDGLPAFQNFKPGGPDMITVLRPVSERRSGSTLRLPDTYPDW